MYEDDLKAHENDLDLSLIDFYRKNSSILSLNRSDVAGSRTIY